MKKGGLSLLIVTFLTIFTLSTFAQSTKVILTRYEMVTYKGIVIDSVSSERLPGAIVIITTPDGLYNVKGTDEKGEFSFSTFPFPHMSMEVSMLGYKVKRFPLPLSPERELEELGEIRLAPDVQQIEAVEVKARAMLFRTSGDTVIYNPSLIRMRDGASALELVAKLPGVEVSEYGVKVGGKDVERTYVNGETLYGKQDPMTALKYLRADEIRQIMAYDEVDEASALVRGKNARKRRVLNMLTFRPIQTSTDFNAMAGGGADLNSGANVGKGRYLGELDFKYFSMKRRLSLEYMGNNLGIDRSAFGYNRIGSRFESMDAASSARRGDSRSHAVSASWEEQLGLTELTAQYAYSDNRHSMRTALRNDYFPTAAYASRTYGDTSRTRTAASEHRGAFLVKRTGEKSDLDARIYTTFFDRSSQNRIHSLLSVDDRPLNRQSAFNRSEGDGHRLSANTTYHLRFPNRFGFYTRWLLNSEKNSSDGLRADTLPSSTGHYLVGTSGDGTNTQLNGSINVSKNSRKYGTLNLSYRFEYTRERKTQVAADLFSGAVDPTLTYRYTNRMLSHIPAVSWNLMDKKNQYSLSLDARASNLLRDERVPLSPRARRTFAALEPSLIYMHNFSGIGSFGFRYALSHTLPGLEMVSDKLDNANPLLLQGGNPRLRQSYTHNISADYTEFGNKSQNTFSIKASARIMGREHVLRRQFFAEPTYLPAYDYTTQPGATLTTVENSTKTTLVAGLQSACDTRIGPLRSMLSLEAGYDYAQSPSYIGGRLSTGYRHMPGLKAALQSNFAKSVSVKIYSTTGFKYETTSDKDYDRAVDERAGIDFTADFLGRLTFGTAYEYHSYRSYAGRSENFMSNVWNAYLGCKMLHGNRGELRLSVFDILGQNKNFLSTMYVDYIERRWEQLYSRYFTVSFYYRFHKTK